MSKKDSHATNNMPMSEEDLNDFVQAKRRRRYLTPQQLRRSLVSTATSSIATSWSSLIKVATSCKSGSIRRFVVGYASRSNDGSSTTGTDLNHYPTATRSFANFCLSLGLAGGATMAATLISMDLVLPKTRIMTDNPVFVYVLWMFLFAEVARVATTATVRRPLAVVPVMLPGDDDTLSCTSTSNDECDHDNHWLL
jgi:hypothetical protein